MMSSCERVSVAIEAVRPFRSQPSALTTFAVFVAVAAGAGIATFAQGQCEPQWSEGRGFPGTNGPVYASAEWDFDGPGGQPPLPVVAGSFNIAGEEFANNVAAWNGSAWIPLGNGLPGLNTAVRALQVFDDGTGPALYARPISTMRAQLTGPTWDYCSATGIRAAPQI